MKPLYNSQETSAGYLLKDERKQLCQAKVKQNEDWEEQTLLRKGMEIMKIRISSKMFILGNKFNKNLVIISNHI